MNISSYLWIPLVVWLITQATKFVVAYFKGDFDLRYLFASGGMPSVHSAVVCSLATVALIEGGLGSPLFGITGILAVIVMYDSFGVRRSAGEQARTLNALIEDLGDHGNLRNPANYNKLRVILGHKPLEVVVGAVIGVLLTIAFEGSKLDSQLQWLGTQPGLLITKILAIKAIILFVVAIVFAWWMRYRVKNRRHWQVFTNQLVYGTLVIALLMGSLSLGQFEKVQYFNNWASVVILMLGIVTWYAFVLFGAGVRTWRSRKTVSVDNQRRDKWLKKAKGTKKQKS